MGPNANLEWMRAVIHGHIVKRLHDLYTQHSESLCGIAVTVSPPKHREVRAMRDFGAAELVLVPLTTSIVQRKCDDSSAHPVGAVLLSEKFERPTTHVDCHPMLMPNGGMKPPEKATVGGADKYSLVVPCWYVGWTHEKECANMKVVVMDGIPCIMNHASVSAQETLLAYKPSNAATEGKAAAKRKAQDAKVAERGAPAKKKGKGKGK